MLIPINTDAPLYYFPYATIGLIAANMICFAATGFALHEDRIEPWLLEYGNGINPLEWIPAAFAHGGFGHLIGNMFFLWGFGLVVEGKLGWYRFIPLYLAMAAAWGAGVDLLTVHRTDAYVLKNVLEVGSRDELKQQIIAEYYEPDEIAEADDKFVSEIADDVISEAKGRCLGASGVIFALMGISLVWAPKNEMHIVGFLFYRPVSFEVTIMTYSLWYLALNILELLLMKFEMGSSGLHMVGGVIGFAVGVVFLKKDWVNCEKWDLFAVMSGKYGRFAEPDWVLGAHGNPLYHLKEIPVPDSSDEPDAMLGNKSARAEKNRKELTRVNQLIDSGDILSAVDELMTLRFQDAEICPNAERIRKLATGLLQAQAFDEAEIWLQEFIERFPAENAWARVRMAQLLLTQRQRPTAALKQLRSLPTEALSEPLQALARKVAKVAKDQVRDGVKDAQPEW